VDNIKEAVEKSLGRPVDEEVWEWLREQEYLDGSFSVSTLVEDYKHYEDFARRIRVASPIGGLVAGRVQRGKKTSGKDTRPGSLAVVKCSFAKFSDYTIETLPKVESQLNEKSVVDKNVDAVVGILTKTNHDTAMLHETYLGIDTLFEVLRLARNIDVSTGFCRETVDKIQTSEILDLCRKYGLLRDDNRVWLQYRKPGFLLNRGSGNFAYGLFALKWRFEVYKALFSNNRNLLRELVPDVQLKERFLKRSLSDEEVSQTAKEWLCRGSTLRPITIFPTYDSENDAFVLVTSASDILEACHVHLSLVLIGNGDLGKNLLICQNPQCGRYFIGHGNAKYCPNCDRRTLWSRRKRQEERSARNGKEARKR